MKEFGKSMVLGLLTILVWVLASIEFNTPKQIEKEFAIIENDKKIENSFLETLTMDYKETTNEKSYN